MGDRLSTQSQVSGVFQSLAMHSVCDDVKTISVIKEHLDNIMMTPPQPSSRSVKPGGRNSTFLIDGSRNDYYLYCWFEVGSRCSKLRFPMVDIKKPKFQILGILPHYRTRFSDFQVMQAGDANRSIFQ